jgi:hypothetical protein
MLLCGHINIGHARSIVFLSVCIFLVPWLVATTPLKKEEADLAGDGS